MKKYLLFIIGITFIFHTSNYAQSVKADFDNACFFKKGTGTFIETYISFNGKSLNYINNDDSTLEASVEVTMLFKNDDEVKEYRKYKVVSPPLLDTLFSDFIDLQRISIPNGVYNFQLLLKDNYAADTVKGFKLNQIISINIPQDEIAISGIEFVEKYHESDNVNIFVKEGYECIPYVSSVYPEGKNYFSFYTELYNAAKEFDPLGDFSFVVYIEEMHTSKPIKEFTFIETQQALNTNILYKQFNISTLPTGNYYLVLEVRKGMNDPVLISKKYFQRINAKAKPPKNELKQVIIANTFVEKYIDADSLEYFIKALKPISDVKEALFIDSTLQVSNQKLRQQFFYKFWYSRNQNNPEAAWNAYLMNLNIVEENYKTENLNGYNTDRGRIYLQYGSPNSITVKEENDISYPYEIWEYYIIADQPDIDFIFYSLNQNNFKLIHSTKKGELNNADWGEKLFKNSLGKD